MEDLLTPMSTAYKNSKEDQEDALVEAKERQKAPQRNEFQATSPAEALEILQNEPDFSNLISILKYLNTTSDISLSSPSPLSSQLINILVSDIVTNYWALLSEKGKGSKTFKYKKERDLFLGCFRNVTGLGAISARLNALIDQSKITSKKRDGPNLTQSLRDYQSILEAILRGDTVLQSLWETLQSEPISKQAALWREVTALVGGSRLLNSAAEAHSIINKSNNSLEETTWVADGVRYSSWVASNIQYWAKHLTFESERPWKHLAELLSKSLRLGYPDVILEAVLDLVLGAEDDLKVLQKLLDIIPTYEQKSVLNCALRLLVKRHLPSDANYGDVAWWKEDTARISAGAAYLGTIINGNTARKDLLLSWMTGLPGAGIGEPISIRRAAIAAVSQSKYDLEAVLEKSMQQFGDQLYIKHTPSMQQDVHAQVLLLSAGYVHRTSPMKLKVLARSGVYLNAVSNRLSASSERARFLGMLVGEAISGLVEPTGKQMDFKMEELQSPEAQWYKGLVGVSDSLGSVESLRKHTAPEAKPSKQSLPREAKKPIRPPQHSSKIISIEEIDDDEGSEEDSDLVPYTKPDSDEEDSDEDPTLVVRNKPTAPVYIRDLISYFRDTENYDRQRLALSTAASLIRRKSDFGTEVKDHAEELASVLMGLQDKYDIDDFNDLRLQSMISVLLCDPQRMAKWFARTFFDGDYSISQRASVLSTIAVSARELGGFKEEDKALTKAALDSSNNFPSKRLPERLHNIYAAEESLVDSLSHQLSKTMIQPLAASLADKATGPDILKVRTFSSRLAVESRRAPPTVNALSSMVAESFFFPLTGRFFAHLKAYGGKNVIFESFLLSSYLKTLSLIMHASGRSTLQLPQMTSEFWDLLLAVRSHTIGDKSVREAVLFGFMTLLEVNGDKRQLSEKHGRELLETQRWVETIFGSIGEGEEEERARTLAAGVLYRIREVVEKYQALLMGDLVNF
ncbi:hypothetical protein V495_06279 [Pseudogymnoascus sp. VKM F-4514 (FW-929)]|nr:hypothetical protein V495_06279 [Pseudogymnoascus sp. VKM F-4514 (FW-929)]KFY56473.1 hypothetical protein V497_06227 [Pseudogymnoascus sp. VKM F-4516 (FW-969)]